MTSFGEVEAGVLGLGKEEQRAPVPTAIYSAAFHNVRRL